MLNNLEEIMLARMGEEDYSLGVSLCNDTFNRLFVEFPNDEHPEYVLYQDGYTIGGGDFAHTFDLAAARLRELATRVDSWLRVL